MQTVIVACIVLACLAALLRNLWKQFSSQDAAGCGGCTAAKGCSAQKSGACASSSAGAVATPVRWHRRPGASK
jgi:hypothetical protein